MKNKSVFVVFVLVVMVVLVSCSQADILKASKIMLEVGKYNFSVYSSSKISELKEKLDIMIPEPSSDEQLTKGEIQNIVSLVIGLNESKTDSDAVSKIFEKQYNVKPGGPKEALDLVQSIKDIASGTENIENLINDFFDSISGNVLSDFIEDTSKITSACEKIQTICIKLAKADYFINPLQNMINASRTRSYQSYGDYLSNVLVCDILEAMSEEAASSLLSGNNFVNSFVSNDSGNRIIRDIQALQLITGEKIELERFVKALASGEL